MKNILTFILALCIGLCFCVPTKAILAQDTPPAVSAESAILINGTDGSVYFEKNADRPMGMASTTKLMTALVAAESGDVERKITVPAEAVGVEGSSVYLVEGEVLTMRELLYALLLSSANDAATAIAIATSGSVEDFCVRMNEKAAEMGLVQTHFTNPHGLYDEDHYTTARELAAIAAEALRVPLLREIVATQRATISHDGDADKRLLLNHNKLLRSYEGAIGMKTGFTKKTGRTLVSAAERDGLTLIAVTLNAPDDWRDHTAMLDYGFANYEQVVFSQAGSFMMDFPITGGESDTVCLTNAEPLVLTLPKKRGDASYSVQGTARFLFAPVTYGESFGTVTLTCEGQRVTSPLIVTETVKAKEVPLPPFFRRIKNFFKAE